MADRERIARRGDRRDWNWNERHWRHMFVLASMRICGAGDRHVMLIVVIVARGIDAALRFCGLGRGDFSDCRRLDCRRRAWACRRGRGRR